MDWYTADIRSAVHSLSSWTNLRLLPQWYPMVLASFATYQLLYHVIGPSLTRWLLPDFYSNLSSRKRLDWDIHIVSFTNAVVITILSGRVVLYDKDWRQMDWERRAWDYTQPSALALSVGNGYFYWHLLQMIQHRKAYGMAMVVHASAVAFVMTLGFVRRRTMPWC